MILDDIAASTRKRVDRARARRPIEELRTAAYASSASAVPSHASITSAAAPHQPLTPSDLDQATPGARFIEALRKPGPSFICEVKQASPSAGVISAKSDHLAVAHAYEQAGADAISVLTEPDFFRGDDRYLTEIAATSSLPCLRKDFVIDAYQLYEARLLGASAVLLIVALLDDGALADFIALAADLGLAALVEVHSAEEVERALAAGAPIIGANNRDLATFTVDLAVSERLRAIIPTDVPMVAESGIRTPADVRRMREAGADAVLIGEVLMRSGDVAATLAEFRQAADAVDVTDAADGVAGAANVADAANRVDADGVAKEGTS
jgi:indole-3-glycerol phosphate synthase